MKKSKENSKRFVVRRVALSVLFFIMVPLFFLIIKEIQKYSSIIAEEPIFTVENYDVDGNVIVTKDEIIDLITLDSKQIFNIENSDVESMIERSKFIESVTVEKRYPSTLKITIEEYKPFALKVNDDKMLYYINIYGEIMGEYRGEGEYNLPIIRDDIETELALTFLKEASVSELVKYKISEVFLTDKGVNFSLTDNSINVIVGNGNFDRKVIAFQEFYKNYYDKLDYDSITSIDLRFPKQIIVDKEKIETES